MKILGWTLLALLLSTTPVYGQGFKPRGLDLTVQQQADSATVNVTVHYTVPQNWTVDFPWEVLDDGTAVVQSGTSGSPTFQFTLPMDSVETAYDVCVSIERLSPGAVRTGDPLCEPFLIGLPDPPAPDSLSVQVVRQWYTVGDTLTSFSYSLAYIAPNDTMWYELWLDGEQVSTTQRNETDRTDWGPRTLPCSVGTRCSGLPWDCGSIRSVVVACPTGEEIIPYGYVGDWTDRRVPHDTVVMLVHADHGVLATRSDHWPAIAL